MKRQSISYRKIENKLIKTLSSIKYIKKVKGFLNPSIDSIDIDYKNQVRNYWHFYKNRVNTDWHKWYSSRNGIKDVRYIPENFYYCDIEPFLNNLDVVKAYADKAFLSVLLPEITRPRIIAKNMSGVFYDDEFTLITIEEVVRRSYKERKFVIKPTMKSGGGKNVKFISNSGNFDNDSNVIKNLIKEYKENFIIQETIPQHTDLKRINPESINTIRTISLFFKGQVHILSSVLRMGINHSPVDNQTAGGICTGIKIDGSTLKYAFDRAGNSYEIHPQGTAIKDIKIPAYQQVIAIIISAHSKLGHCKIISWDFAIDENTSPILIEINLRGQGINPHQTNNGPLFNDLTTDVLNDVYGKS